MKKIFIGVDVSKETIDVSVIFPSLTGNKPNVVYYQRFENKPCGFRSMVANVRKVAGGISTDEWLFCCETTGAYDHSLCDYLFCKGLDVWRECALRIRWSKGISRGKNDKADSLAIAEYAWRHQDHMQLYVSPSDTIRQLKTLYLYRQSLVDEMKVRKTRANEIKSTAMDSPALRFMYKDSMKEVERLKESIRKCEEMIEKIIAEDEEMHRNYNHMMTIKGIGMVAAVGLLIYTNNFKTLVNSRQASTYCGCASFYEDSGTSVHKKVDVKNLCNRRLKSTLSMAARRAICTNPGIHAYADRMRDRGKCYGVIINNVRNKLLHIIYSLIKNDCDYEENHDCKRTRISLNQAV